MAMNNALNKGHKAKLLALLDWEGGYRTRCGRRGAKRDLRRANRRLGRADTQERARDAA
jgi:hypothetical protein